MKRGDDLRAAIEAAPLFAQTTLTYRVTNMVYLETLTSTEGSLFSTGQLGFKLRQEQEKGISRERNTSQRAFLPTESPEQDIPSHNSRR